MNATRTSHSGGRMSPVSQAILCYVYEHPDCTFKALQGVFCPDATTGKGSVTERFRARLAYLVSVGHLKRTEIDSACGYRIGNGVRPPKPEPVYAAAEGDDPALRRTPAPQYDRMHCPAYVPDAGPALRSGSLDFKRLASHGYSC
ncbi:MAG: hypothetical protein ABI606_20460 [Rhodoferax sp.]